MLSQEKIFLKFLQNNVSKRKEEIIEIGELIKKSYLDWTIVLFLQPQDTSYKGKVSVGFGNILFMSFAISR